MLRNSASVKRMTRRDGCRLQQTLLWLLLGALIGYVVALWNTSPILHYPSQSNGSGKNNNPTTAMASFVSHLKDTPRQATSHVGVDKQVLVPPFEIAQNFAGASLAHIDPGKQIEWHHHPTMYEVFFITAGQGYVSIVDKQDVERRSQSKMDADAFSKQATTALLHKGSFLLTAPGDYHSFGVDADRTEPMEMIYFGVTTDATR